MALIRCGGCVAVHESTLVVCPGCGRCPCCGERRVSDSELASGCPSCSVPYCSGCGRCHGCGTIRFLEMKPHSCGFPSDVEKVLKVEQSFGLQNRGIAGCSVLLLAIMLVICGSLILAR
jgi:hypothetical protein